MSDLQDIIDILKREAPALRQAGVAHLTVGDVQITLESWSQVPAEDEDDEEPSYTEPADPLDDPITFGGRLPTLRRGES